MSVKTTRYVRKPLYVDVVQVTSENFEEVAEWCQGDIEDDYIRVRVHNPKNTRQTRAYIEDWILYTDRGYKVYTTKAFHNSFDLANEKHELGYMNDNPNQRTLDEPLTEEEEADEEEIEGATK